MAEDSSLHTLLDSLPQTGEVLWIGLRPGNRESVEVVEGAEAVPGNGLELAVFLPPKNREAS